MTQEAEQEAVRQAWPTIKSLLESEVLTMIRINSNNANEAGALATAAVKLIDCIDARYSVLEPVSFRRSPALRTGIQQ